MQIPNALTVHASGWVVEVVDDEPPASATGTPPIAMICSRNAWTSVSRRSWPSNNAVIRADARSPRASAEAIAARAVSFALRSSINPHAENATTAKNAANTFQRSESHKTPARPSNPSVSNAR